MKQVQYTIRGVNPIIDNRLRERAKRSKQSMDSVLLEALRVGLSVSELDTFDKHEQMPGLRNFDNAIKHPSPYNREVPLKELYQESVSNKYHVK